MTREARPKIAIDETGNTGPNLLDPDQPVFVLASVHIELDEAKKLLASEGFGQHNEAHYTDLRGSGEGRGQILRILQSATVSGDDGHITAFHKRFMIVTKIVDDLLEELAHRTGGPDFYKRRLGFSLSNLIYYCTPTFCGKEDFDRCLEAFVQMRRTRTEHAVTSFYDTVDRLIERCSDDDYRSFPLTALRATEPIARDLAEYGDKIDLDPAIPAFVDHAAIWSAFFDDPFDVLHDESQTISSYRDQLELLIGRDQEFEVGHFDVDAQLPLKIDDLRFIDSEDDPRVQIADLYAGAGRDYLAGLANPEDQNRFWRGIRDVGIEDILSGGMYPDPDIFPPEAYEPEDPDYQNPLDQVIDLINRNTRRGTDEKSGG